MAKAILQIIFNFPYTLLTLSPFFHQNLPNSLKRKMLFYGSSVPILIGKPILALSNLPTTSSKQELMILSSAIIPLLDYINDSSDHSESYLTNLYKNYTKSSFSNPTEIVFTAIYLRILELSENNSQISSAISKNLNAQLLSLQQYSETNFSKVKRLLADKGGFGVLQYCTIINPTLSSSQSKALYQLGYWLQLLDDQKDESKDIKKNINTIATLTHNSYHYTQLLKAEKETTLKLLSSMEGNKEAKTQLINNLKLIPSN
jgi:hypothetical protein